MKNVTVLVLIVLGIALSGCTGTKWNRSPRTSVHNVMEHAGIDWFKF